MDAKGRARFAEITVETLGDRAVGGGDVGFKDSCCKLLAPDVLVGAVGLRVRLLYQFARKCLNA